ncbi:MAG: hypothetical protein IPM03_01795 [Sulfuritalea sp.]|nr:hypothetical protein [Sulfuritalea sp.]
MTAHTATFDHDTKLRARDYVDRLQQESLARSASGSHADVLGYWRARSGMYRHLAAVVVTAVKSRMSDGERWSLERFRQDLLNRTAEPASRAEFQRWFDHRHGMLRSITRRLWQLATEQEPPLAGLWLALEAQPNPDFESGTHNGSISIPLKWHSIADIADGRRRVLDFIKYNQLGGGNFVGKAGQIARNGEPWVHISYNGRIWKGWEFDSKAEVDEKGNPISQVDEQSQSKPHSFKFEVLAGGGWASNSQRYETPDQAQSAARELSSRWMAVEDWRVVPSDEPPNQQSKIVVIQVGDKPPVTPVAPPPQPQEENVLRYSLQIRGRWGESGQTTF